MNRLHQFLICAIFVCLQGCGLDRSSHYGDEKTFGRTPPPNSESGPFAPPLTDEPESPPTTTETPPAEPSDEVLPTPVDETDPMNALLGHYGFAGDFNPSSIKKIVKGDQEASLAPLNFVERGVLLGLGISSIINGPVNSESLEILTQENGANRNVVTQIAKTAKGDALAAKAGKTETVSGIQTLHWVFGDQARECPSTFICVDRITWQPNQGQEFSYCFRSLKDGTSIAVPFSPNSQFGPQHFEDDLPANGAKTSTPFIISKHDGVVDCNNPEVVTLDTKTVQWSVEFKRAPRTLPANFYKTATLQPITPDSEITLKYGPYNQELGRIHLPNDSTFIDTISRFSSSTTYFISSKERVFAKIVKTNQLPVSVPVATSILGLQVDYEFEFCTHKNTVLVPTPFNHCPVAVRR